MSFIEVLFSLIAGLLALIQFSFWNWKSSIDKKINDFDDFKGSSFEMNSKNFVLRQECYKEHLNLAKYNDEKFSRIESELSEIKKILLKISDR